MASSSAVFPAPLGPVTAVSPGGRSSSSCSWFLKSLSQSLRSCTPSSADADRHQEVEEVGALDGLDEGRL